MAAFTNGPSLCEFLMEAELAHYLNPLRNDLKISSVAQLKYVEQDDLYQIGMTKPEQRRLWKHFQKYFPQTYLRKIKNIIKSRNKKDGDRASIYSPDSTVEKTTVKVPSKHIIPFENIVINKQLGVGEFGVVQQGVWTNEDGERVQVAIKCLSEEKMQKNHMEFLKEAAIMHAVDHESIVHLYGVVLETNALMLVTELAPLRSLLECLKEPALRASFPVISLCEFAYQICDGMQYLESKKLIHRDLAARNILVFGKNKLQEYAAMLKINVTSDRDFGLHLANSSPFSYSQLMEQPLVSYVVKISDFGLSRALGVGKDYYQTNFNVNLKLPIAWCAPECINYLRFTSASDVWAYGVTLWEMFSYGFQPWAALTGQQILEAIDEPNFQRLEQPECCPKEYYTLMLRCWQHDPSKRPKFVDIFQVLPEYKPIQVQAVQDFTEPLSNSKPKKDWLKYRTGDVIAVLDKRPLGDVPTLWKGVLNNGKTGLFDPAETVSYLGQNLPTTRSSFSRADGKSSFYSSKRRLRTDMISRPQGDFKHTGHVGLDGAFFGDISFLGDKYHQLPKQIVAPYKPQDDKENVSPALTAGSDSSDKTPLLINTNISASNSSELEVDNWSDACYDRDGENSHLQGSQPKNNNCDINSSKITGSSHEYHEIEDDDDLSLAESAKFESLDFGPSLVDEVLMALSNQKPDYVGEIKTNEVKSVSKESTAKSAKESFKKRHAVVKPISAADQQTLDSAIEMAKELASKSMLDLESRSDNDTPQGSPKTPTSPLKQKFSFKFKNSPKTERRNFSEEAEAIPDIQDIITEEAKEVYDSLVQKGEVLTQCVTSAHTVTPLSCTSDSKSVFRRSQNLHGSNNLSTDVTESELENSDASPLRMLKSNFPVKPKFRGNRHGIPGSGRASAPCTATVARIAANAGVNSSVINTALSQSQPAYTHPPSSPPVSSEMVKENESARSTSELRSGSRSDSSNANTSVTYEENFDSLTNPLPLPPRDRTKPVQYLKHHQRKYPLVIPDSQYDTSFSLTKPSSCPNVPLQTTLLLSHQTERRASEGSGGGSAADPTVLQEVSVSSAAASPSQSSKHFNRSILPHPPPKPARTCYEGEVLELPLEADHSSSQAPVEEEAVQLVHRGDHVSCEDLLEFALDKPNIHRTQGRARGTDSDEVRIMQKVLSKEHITPEECLIALNETDWDVHKAIKYEKLQLMISLPSVSPETRKEALEKCDWNVQCAANCLLSSYSISEDTTEV